jgi:hypothetical protein
VVVVVVCFDPPAPLARVQTYRCLQGHGYAITSSSARDVVGRHPLHAAALHNCLEFAALLLDEVRLAGLSDS